MVMRRWNRQDNNRRKNQKLVKGRKSGGEGRRKEESEVRKQGMNEKRKRCGCLAMKESREADSSFSCDVNDQVQTKSFGNCDFMLNPLAVILLLSAA